MTVGTVENVCEWVVEGCERLAHLWWRACSEGGGIGEDDHHRALRSLLLGAAARATHALTPLTAPNAAGPPPPLLSTQVSTSSEPSLSLAGMPPGLLGGLGLPPGAGGPDSKDPQVVAMMQQYTDMLVNMVQQKMAAQQTPPPPGPT